MDQEQLNAGLWLAARYGQTEKVEDLVKKGADVNYTELDGWSVLHAASRWGGNPETVSRLVERGADINAKDRDGETPLDYASGKTKILLQTYNSNSKSSPTSTLPSPSEDLDIKKPTCTLETVSTNLGTSPPAPPSFDHELCNGFSRLIQSGVNISQATEAVKHCSSLEEAHQYIQSLPPAATLPSNMPPDGGVQQTDQDVMLSGIVDPAEFKSLLKQGGTYKSYGNRIYLAGACSVGKSTLASLLIGDDIPLEWKSTDGLKIFFGRNGIHLEERKMVPLDKDKENPNIIANVLRGEPGMDKSQQDMAESHPEDFSEHKDNSQQQAISVSSGLESTQEAAAAQLMSGVSTKQQIVKEKRKMQQVGKPMQKFDILDFTSIHEDIKKELKSGTYKVKKAPSDLVDFGGQKSYDMTHQLFIQGKGTFTLIFDGRKGLQDRLAEYPQGEVTTASILKHWVDSILTYCGEEDDDILPVILFVATHRDTLKEDEQSEKMTDFKQGLTEMFQNHERKTRIKYDDIFFINTTDGDDPEVIRLQATYVDIAFLQKSWGKSMPMAWVPLELQLSKMRSRNISIISKDDLIKVNEQNDDLALTTGQLDEFLRVQHLLGNILFFEGQGLADYVIVQPTVLVDILNSQSNDRDRKD